MEDREIINLFFERSENAIAQTKQSYGAYCEKIAFNILFNAEDAEECLQDCLFKVWNAIPPARPASLKSFLGKITRNLALDRYDKQSAQKRGCGQVALALDELSECVGAASDVESEIAGRELSALIDSFLGQQKAEARQLFVRRYWYLDSIKDLAGMFGMSESNVKTSLFRMRQDLKRFLEDKGVRV